MNQPGATSRATRGQAFPETRWTLVFRARAGGSEASVALDELCRRYWPPIYAFLRGRGHSPPDAEDYTQQFFAEMLSDETFASVDPTRGRLRTFLLAALKRSLADQTRWRCREKRGGGVAALSLEAMRAAELFFAEPVDDRDPETLYFITWARNLVEQARQRLRETYGDRASIYTALEPFLDREDAGRYRETAERLGITENAARGAISRLRKRFAELLREEVRQTVGSPQNVEAELGWVRAILSNG